MAEKRKTKGEYPIPATMIGGQVQQGISNVQEKKTPSDLVF
jgi:hypothetical protein